MSSKTIGATTVILTAFLLTQTAALASFGDVSSAHPNREAIEYVQDKGIVSGYADGMYRPDSYINRAEFVKILARVHQQRIAEWQKQHPGGPVWEDSMCISIFGDPEIGLPFKDVKKTDWFAHDVCYANSQRLVDGYPDGTFRPANHINFAEAAKIIVNGFGLTEQSSIASQPWYKGYVDALASKKAVPVSIAGFDALLSRGEMAEIIYRLQAGVTTKHSLTYENLASTQAQPGDVLLRKGNDLLLHTIGTHEFNNVLYSGELHDFDLSDDAGHLAYSLSETGFNGNSDIYFKNLVTGQTRRLTEKNTLTSSDPVIFPNNGRVAYIRRSYNASTKTLSDGELWVINADGNSESSFRVASSRNIQGLNSEADCISEEERKMVKLSIERISPAGDAIAYQQKDWAPECSGLWDELEVKKLDGSEFFTKRFRDQNMFEYHTDVWDESRFEWDVEHIFWLPNGDFIVMNWAYPPLSFTSMYLYDAKQTLQQKLFDSSENPGYKRNMTLVDVKEAADGSLLLLLRGDKNDGSYQEQYFTYRLRRGENIDMKKLEQSSPFISERLSVDARIESVRILDEYTVIYGKQVNAHTFELWSYDIRSGENTLLQGFTQRLDFDIANK